MKTNNWITGIIAGFLFISCNDLLDIDPADRMTQANIQEMVKKNPEEVLEPMVTSLVSQVHGYGTGSVNDRNLSVLHIRLNFMGNDVVKVKTGWLDEDYRMRDWRTQISPIVPLFWRNYYTYIFYANQILAAIPEDLDLSVAGDGNRAIMKYKATALTLRAFSYTGLMWLYQNDYLHGGKEKAGVPLYTTTTNVAQGRASSTEVWELVMNDATEAVRLFKATDNYLTENRTDVDGSVASVVLARAALTLGEWQTAISAASDVIDAYPDLFDETEYTTLGFSLLDKETIFGHEYSSATSKGQSSFSGWMNIYSEGGYGGSQQTSWLAIDQRLYDQIPETDYRKKNFVGEPFEFIYPNNQPVTVDKYVQTKFATTTIRDQTAYNQDEIYMRASEMYLVKAEAEARSGSDAAAQNTLYQLVSKRDPAYVQSARTGDALLEEIRLHRRIELWAEAGHEFYDNKRWHIGVDRVSSANHIEKVQLEAGKFTLQIPLETEINYNPNITEADQNPL
ncbi:MAG: RagB/SusD family nutrient uptake outer membrane protein [Tannerella sp.]|nr:RagB/SusD family nutrient uptake outer membrane protein [Tannerella sp.]